MAGLIVAPEKPPTPPLPVTITSNQKLKIMDELGDDNTGWSVQVAPEGLTHMLYPERIRALREGRKISDRIVDCYLEIAFEQFLKDNPHVQRSDFLLCTDVILREEINKARFDFGGKDFLRPPKSRATWFKVGKFHLTVVIYSIEESVTFTGEVVR